MCTARDPIEHYYTRNYTRRACMRGVCLHVCGINIGDLVQNSPIHQIRIPAKVSSYMVYAYLNFLWQYMFVVIFTVELTAIILTL